jgi:hypothetical protein
MSAQVSSRRSGPNRKTVKRPSRLSRYPVVRLSRCLVVTPTCRFVLRNEFTRLAMAGNSFRLKISVRALARDRRTVGRLGYFEVVHASDALNDAAAHVVPDVHAEGEMRLVFMGKSDSTRPGPLIFMT